MSALVTLLLSLTFSFLCRKRLIRAMGPHEADVTISISHMQQPRSRDKISHPWSKGNWMEKLRWELDLLTQSHAPSAGP